MQSEVHVKNKGSRLVAPLSRHSCTWLLLRFFWSMLTLRLCFVWKDPIVSIGGNSWAISAETWRDNSRFWALVFESFALHVGPHKWMLFGGTDTLRSGLLVWSIVLNKLSWDFSCRCRFGSNQRNGDGLNHVWPEIPNQLMKNEGNPLSRTVLAWHANNSGVPVCQHLMSQHLLWRFKNRYSRQPHRLQRIRRWIHPHRGAGRKRRSSLEQ